MSAKNKDTRHRCQFCGVTTWEQDYGAFMRDHDRPDGNHCRRAQDVYAPIVRKPSWAQ